MDKTSHSKHFMIHPLENRKKERLKGIDKRPLKMRSGKVLKYWVKIKLQMTENSGDLVVTSGKEEDTAAWMEGDLYSPDGVAGVKN